MAQFLRFIHQTSKNSLKELFLLTTKAKQTLLMTKNLLFTISLSLGIGVAYSQAPVGPRMEMNLSTIDSLTMQLYSEIPSHVAAGEESTPEIINESAYTEQVNKLGTAIPLPYNNLVSVNIGYLMRQNEAFYNMLHQRMHTYFPIYEQVLDKYKLPQELKYVSIIESHLNPNAVSWCGATGLWQFMPYTGKSMGMKIDYTLDERKSIITSTEKACEYFANSYKIFGDWLLAIASYNCGPGNVQKAINRAGGVKDFWKIKHFLPKETQAYVPKFIAAVYVLNFTKYSTFGHNQTSSLLVPTPVDSTVSLTHISSYLGVDESVIYSYNRELLRKTATPEKVQSIMLPYDLSMKFLENRDSIYAYARRQAPVQETTVQPAVVKRNVARYHTVRKGQTLYSISKRYGVTVAQLKKWNRLKSNVAPVGRRLVYYK